MGQPVKLSDELVNEARIAAVAMQRSIAGQVEFWASLGKAMEAVMNGDDLHRTRKVSTARSLSESLETVNEPLGRTRLAAYLDSRPFPRFIADPVEPRVFIRQDADGKQTRGRVVGRTFQPLVEEHELLPR